LSNTLKKIVDFNVEQPPDIVIFLVFYEEDKKRAIFLWCQVKNHKEDYITKDLEIGLQFIKEGIVDSKNKTKILWKKIPPQQGQDNIAKWVFIKNLMLIKKEMKLNRRE